MSLSKTALTALSCLLYFESDLSSSDFKSLVREANLAEGSDLTPADIRGEWQELIKTLTDETGSVSFPPTI